MLKFVILAVCAFVLWKLFAGDKRKKEEVSQKQTEHKAASGELVKDPVCGAYVLMDSDIRVREGEKVHRFCSYECRDKFLKQIGAHTQEDESSEDKE